MNQINHFSLIESDLKLFIQQYLLSVYYAPIMLNTEDSR